ncbi:MAG: arylesterase [Verrucomicrobia bacterium]|nr:arylesterase [Verrucomicrobiota bacterium]
MNPTARARRRLRGSLLLALALLSPLLPAATPAAAPRTVVFLGDSLTAGYGLADPASEAYPALIAERLRAARTPWKVVNAGISGDTTAGGLRRIDWTLRAPVDVLVVALGANDGLRGVDPAVTAANLRGIIERARARHPAVRILLAGMQLPPELGAAHTAAFARVFPDVAAATGSALVPFLLAGVGGNPALNLGDRIHPNAAGHAVMAATVWFLLEPLLGP